MSLQERLLGEDGNPRKTKDNEDPFRMGLVLEWVYGTIVSTAEKARDSAKKPLGERSRPAYACCRKGLGLYRLSSFGKSARACLGMASQTAHNSRWPLRHDAQNPSFRCAGGRQPSPEAAHDTLCAALQEQASWEQRAHVAKELLHEMLKSRREATDLQQQYDIK